LIALNKYKQWKISKEEKRDDFPEFDCKTMCNFNGDCPFADENGEIVETPNTDPANQCFCFL
jgi:uncharacterized protein YuzB (UPF0349 family)